MRISRIWIVTSVLLWVVACGGPVRREAPSKTPEGDSKPLSTLGATDDAPPADVAVNAADRVSDLAIGRPVTVSSPPNRLYPAEGAKSLVDGLMGSEDYYDLEWMGWWYDDEPFEATIDLGKVVPIDELGVHVLSLSESWIFYPRSVEFEVSADGESYKVVGKVSPTAAELDSEYPATKILKATGLSEQARFVRVRAERYGPLPEWHLGFGGADGYEGEAWLFIDEILVNPR